MVLIVLTLGVKPLSYILSDMDGIGLSDFAGTGLELFKKVSAFSQVPNPCS